MSSSYPCSVADRQDARLRLTVRSSAKGKGPARLTDQTPALRETSLICLQADSWTPTDGAARNTPMPSLRGPQVPSKTMCFHVGQIPQHTQRVGANCQSLKLKITLCLLVRKQAEKLHPNLHLNSTDPSKHWHSLCPRKQRISYSSMTWAEQNNRA